MNIYKKYKYAILLIALGFASKGLMACDVCGCFMGIVPYDQQSGFSFMHRYRSFSGYAQSGQTHTFFPQNAYLMTGSQINSVGIPHSSNRITHGGSDIPVNGVSQTPKYANSDNEIYRAYELRAKFFIHKRVEFNAIAAINDNSKDENENRQRVSGLSDITIYAGYHILQKVNIVDWQQRLILGSGIKLPVGNYYAANEYNIRYPLLMQPGTGSVDYFGYIAYVLGYHRWGFSVNMQYKWNGQNFYHERIGNSINNFVNLFYKMQVKQTVLIPSIQLYYEYTKGVYISDSLIPATNMNVLLIGPGLDVHYKNLAFNIAFQFRAWEQTESQNLSSAGKMIVGISYYFNQTKNLLKSKNDKI